MAMKYKPVSWLLIKAVRLYQLTLSPWIGQQCRFTPTCSQYMIEAIQTHGPIKGTCLGTWRICRCNPLCQGGMDPVPPKRNKGIISSVVEEKQHPPS